jgi:hypothetical protein
MGKISAFLQRKVFGVKVLYIVAALVVVALFFALRMKSGVPDSADTPVEDVASGDTGITDAEAKVNYPDTDGTGTVTATPPSTSVGTTTPEVTPGSYTATPEETNETWGRKAIEWLVKNAGASADGATIAIQKYLNGDQLSFAEGQLRDKAVTAIGFPPVIPPSGGTVGKPVVTTPSGSKPVVKVYKAPATHTVTGAGDDQWTDLARLYYHDTSASHIDLIQAANVNAKGYKHSGKMAKGTKLYIPKERNAKMYKVVKGKTTAAAIAKANGISVAALHELNDVTHFPAKVGQSVRVA